MLKPECPPFAPLVRERNGQTHVVVIDDQSSSRTLISRIMESIDESVTVDAFKDPRGALGWMKTNRPSLVVTDYRMPEMDGIQVVRELRQRTNTTHTPIVIITICEDKVIRRRALESGATDFLIKPFDYDECRARCRNLLALNGYQSILAERIVLLNARMKSMLAANNASNLSSADCDKDLQATGAGQHVAIDYNDLYELTSTVSAIERLLRPLQGKINSLENSLDKPLKGEERNRRSSNPEKRPLLETFITQKEPQKRSVRSGIESKDADVKRGVKRGLPVTCSSPPESFTRASVNAPCKGVQHRKLDSGSHINFCDTLTQWED
jgi:DNA-binding response OmpR family regulator